MLATRRVAVLVALCATAHAAPALAQLGTDDPSSPRNGVSYMSSDFVRQLAKVRDFDPASERLRSPRLAMGDVRLGSAPSLRIARTLSLLVEGGVVARFLLTRSYLVSTDWTIVAMPEVSVRMPHALTDVLCDVRTECALRVGAGVRHVSAHGGDEFMQTEHLPFLIYSRDGYIARVSLETRYAGGRFEINDDVRGYGLYGSTQLMEELWVRPLPRAALRFGALRREVPGVDAPYEAVYAALPFRVSNQHFDIHARLTRGAVPIGYAHGALENAATVELIVR